jgi:hypothetical protein
VDHPYTEVVIDGGLEGQAGTSNFLLQQGRDVILKGQSGSHIMMITSKTS